MISYPSKWDTEAWEGQESWIVTPVGGTQKWGGGGHDS